MLQRKPIKFLTILFILVLFSSNVFALVPSKARDDAWNVMLDNPLRKPIFPGTDVVLTKQFSSDSFWWICFPVKDMFSLFSHNCFRVIQNG